MAAAFRSKGAYALGTTSFVAAVPTGGDAPVAGDALYIIMESTDSTTTAGTPATPGTWTPLYEQSTNIGSSGTTGVTTLTVFGKIAGSSEGDVTVSGVGNHCSGSMLVVMGHGMSAITETVVGAEGELTTSGGTLTIPGITVTANSLIVQVAGLGRDANNTATAGTWTNANLADITEREDNTTSTGAGGGVAYTTSTCAGTTTGDSTVEIAAGTGNGVHLGIKPGAASWAGQVVFPTTFTSVTNGVRTSLNNQVAAPTTFGAVTNGTRVLRGQVVTPITFTAFTDGTASTPTLTTSVARISLAPGSLPKNYQNHAINVRARVTSGTGTLKVALYEGANNRSGDLSQALTTSLADYSLSIAEGSANDITSYADLELRIWGEASGAVTFEVDQASLSIPEAALAGQTTQAFTFGSVTSGKVTAKGNTTQAFTFGTVTNGVTTRFGQVVSPFTFDAVTQGRVTAKSQVVSPFTFGSVTNGVRVGLGQVITPITFGVFVDGDIAAGANWFGQVVSPFTFTAVTSGVATHFGKLVSPFTFERVVSGKVTAKSQVVSPFTFGSVTTGKVSAKAQVALPITFDAVTNGTIQGSITGQVVFPVTWTATTNGARTTFGQVVSPLSFNRVVSGKVTAKSAVSTPITFGATTNGVRTRLGQVALPVTFERVTTGKLTAKGAVALPITFDIVTVGTTGDQREARVSWVELEVPYSAPVASVSLPVTFGRVTTGRVEAKSAVSTPITFSVATAAIADHRAAVSLPITFDPTIRGFIGATKFAVVVAPFTFGRVTTGKVTAKAAVVLPISFNVTTVGKIHAKAAVSFPITFNVLSVAQSRIFLEPIVCTVLVISPKTCDSLALAIEGTTDLGDLELVAEE